MKVKSKIFNDEIKCGGCNYRVSTLYSFPKYNIKEEGLCSCCFMGMIVEGGWNITGKGVG